MSEGDMKKEFNPVIVLVLGVLVIGGMILYSNYKKASVTTTNNSTVQNAITPTPTTTPTTMQATPKEDTTMEKTVKEFKVAGSPFKYDVTEMKVKSGDTVRIVFTNVEGVHDWKIDEFNAATKVLKAGEQETIEFVANKKGTFEYYCSVGNHRAMGMKGNLIVE